MSEALTVRQESAVGQAMSVKDILDQKALIQDAMKAAMIDGQHYGKIPGCGDKPTLLQPGAQTILLLFRMCPDYDITQSDLANAHREYSVKCRLTSASGSFLGAGVGSCSTMEGKYRFRVAPKTLTDRPVPSQYWDLRKSNPEKAQAMIGGRGFSTKKDDHGNWMISEGSSEKVEHDNPADYYNTCLKMAKKRALVDATLTRTAASDIFTQDIEDLKANAEVYAHDEVPHAMPLKERGKHAASQTPRKAIPAVHDATEDQRARMVKLLEPMRQAATQMFIELAWLMPNETLEDTPLTKVPTTKGAMDRLMAEVQAFVDGVTPQPTHQTKTDDEWWREIIVPVPHKGQTRTEYLKTPDTIGGLYDMCEADEEARRRLFGFVNHFQPKSWTKKDGTEMPPSEADIKFREALDAFNDWHEKARMYNLRDVPQMQRDRLID